MAEKLLIINADDFGFTEGVNEGVIQAHAEGAVTSTSLMVNGEAAEGAHALRQHPELSVGLHFQISDKDLEKRCRAGERLSEEEITRLEQDFRKQLEAFTGLTGNAPTHIDGHYSVHEHPDIEPFVRRYCKENGVPRRGVDSKLNKSFFAQVKGGGSDPGRISVDALLEIIDGFEEGVNELMCHPGIADADLDRVTSYVKERQIELSTLTDDRVTARLGKPDVRLVNWTDPGILDRA